MTILGFDHYQLDSFDIERTRSFYEALGGHVVQTMERDNGWKGYHIRLAEKTVIEVQPPRIVEECGGSNGWGHVALEVDSCATASRMVEKAGGRIEKLNADNIMGTAPIVNSVVYGPDGEKIELVQILEKYPSKQSKSEKAVIIGTSHVQLNSLDVEKSRAFYEAAFGGAVISPIMDKDGKTFKGYLFQIVPGSVLEIQPPRFGKSDKTSAWNTIAIETDDIHAACEKVKNAGGILDVGPKKNQMGTIEILNAVIIGPDDEHIELIQLI